MCMTSTYCLNTREYIALTASVAEGKSEAKRKINEHSLFIDSLNSQRNCQPGEKKVTSVSKEVPGTTIPQETPRLLQ
jgi:hypothetical protein